MNEKSQKSTVIEKTDKRPCFSIPARPLSVDIQLLNLELETEVIVSTSLPGWRCSGARKAKDAIEDIERIIKRQAKGRYTMLEVAEIMAAAHNLDACDFLKTRMYPAYESGALKLLDPKDGGLVRARQCKEYYDWVTPANLDKWLETEFEFRWPVEVPVAAGSASTTPDPDRRLARLRELGGNVTCKRGDWKITGMSALVASEKSEDRKRSDEKTIRVDLKEAAVNELEAKRANAFSGLGQR